MTDKGLIVENPLELISLFGDGIYMPVEQGDRKYSYHGSGDLGILNVLDYDMPQIPSKAFDVLGKIMTAVVRDGKNLSPADYSTVNSAEVLSASRLADIIDDFKPQKLLIWTDKWEAPEKEILFYQTGNLSEIPTLRCHALHTMVIDPDRKRECWSAIKRFFDM